VTLEGTGIVALVLYLGALVAITLRARRARMDSTPSDFYLGGRSLPLFVLFFTLYATTYSGNTLLGYPGEAYRRGFSWTMATGFMIAINVTFLALAPVLRQAAERHGLVTPGDWIGLRFGSPALTRVVGAIQGLALTNFLLAQLIAMGHVASGLTGGALPHAAGVIGFALVILAYETLGGMRAVAWTDVAQGILLLVGLAAMLDWLLEESGGVASVTRWVLAHRPALAAVPSADECRNWASSLLLLGVGSVVYPQSIQRIFAAKDRRALYRSFALMAWMPFCTVFVVTLVGIAAVPLLSGLGTIGADEVVPRIIRLWAEEGPRATLLATLVLLGALAAIMSTADSLLLSLGSVVAIDIAGWDRLDPRTTKRGQWIAAGLFVAMIAIAVIPRLTLWRLIELKMEILIQCAPAFLLGARWRALTAGPVLLGLVAGCVVGVWGIFADVPRMAGVHTGVAGLAINLAVVLAGGWLARGRATGAAEPRATFPGR